MQLCAVAHPHYREVLEELDLTPGDFTTVEDLRRLPVLQKYQYIEAELWCENQDGDEVAVGSGVGVVVA